MSRKNILICDLSIKKQGHYIGFNQFILDKFQDLERENKELYLLFLFNAEAKDLLSIPSYLAERVFFLDNDSSKETFKSRITLLKRVSRFASEKNVASMLFMDLDKFQFAIALTKFSCTISGILFRPHHRIDASNKKLVTQGKYFFRKWKKVFAEKLLLVNNKLERILILNDQEGVEILNKKYGKNIFHFLPDPIFNYLKEPVQEKMKEQSVFTFLLFGALNERKNITNIIKAYSNADFGYKTRLLIVGPGTESYYTYLKKLLSNSDILHKEYKSIEIKNEYVSNEQMEIYFAESNVCLLIYKNFFGSSGLMGRAALHKVKVIGPNVGLLSQLIKEYKIGLTCDPESVESISASLVKIKEKDIARGSFHKFYENHSPELFLKQLLNLSASTLSNG